MDKNKDFDPSQDTTSPYYLHPLEKSPTHSCFHGPSWSKLPSTSTSYPLQHCLHVYLVMTPHCYFQDNSSLKMIGLADINNARTLLLRVPSYIKASPHTTKLVNLVTVDSATL